MASYRKMMDIWYDFRNENKEPINEGSLPKFQALNDVSYYDRDWGQTFKDLGTGYPRIDYGPRENDMYDWNFRPNYQAATKEYHAHMTKVAKKLNTAVKELDGLYKVWNKILEKHRGNDER